MSIAVACNHDDSVDDSADDSVDEIDDRAHFRGSQGAQGRWWEAVKQTMFSLLCHAIAHLSS